jgi:hypothetical protein
LKDGEIEMKSQWNICASRKARKQPNNGERELNLLKKPYRVLSRSRSHW